MANRNLAGGIALTKLPQAVIKELKGKSGMIRGVFLPIDGNHLTEKNGEAYMDIRVVIREEEDNYGQIGFVAKSVPSSVYKELKDDKDKLNAVQPILGNLKDFSGGGQSNTDPAPVVGEDEDLPF